MVFIPVRFAPDLEPLRIRDSTTDQGKRKPWSIDPLIPVGYGTSIHVNRFIQNFLGNRIYNKDQPTSDGLVGCVDLYLRRGGNEILLDLKKTGAQQGLSRVQPDDCIYVTRAKNPWIPPPPPPEKVVQEAPPPQAAPQPLPVQPQQPMSKRERKPTTTTRTQSPTQRRQPTYIHLPVVPPVDWNGFIAYWEEQAEREMEAL